MRQCSLFRRNIIGIVVISFSTWQLLNIIFVNAMQWVLISEKNSQNNIKQVSGNYIQSYKHQGHQIIAMGPNPINFTFDEPLNYSGPIVQYWGPTKGRYVPQYIKPDEDTILTDISCLNISNVKVLIIVQSSPTMLDRRNSNRLTWMQLQKKYPYVKAIFIFGTQDPKDTQPFMPIEPERQQHCDVVQMDYVDHYENVTLDTISALKFVQKCIDLGRGPDFVVLADDDTYINIPMLWALLYEEKKLKDNSTTLLGHLYITPQVLRPSPEKIFVDRVVTPEYMYNRAQYPNFLSGSCYVLPISTIPCLYSASLALPYFHINDIHVTGFAAESCGFSREEDRRFHPGKAEIKDIQYRDVSFHFSSAERKTLLYNIIVLQHGEMHLKLANRFVFEKGNLLYCHSFENCTLVID